MAKSLATMAAEVFANNTDKGWHETDRTFGDDIALLHSEVSEALEAFRDHGTSDIVKFITEHGFAIHHATNVNTVRRIEAGEVPKPLGIGSEFADVLIRLLDTCGRYGIDLEAEYERKMAFNRTRPHRHGGRNL